MNKSDWMINLDLPRVGRGNRDTIWKANFKESFKQKRKNNGNSEKTSMFLSSRTNTISISEICFLNIKNICLLRINLTAISFSWVEKERITLSDWTSELLYVMKNLIAIF